MAVQREHRGSVGLWLPEKISDGGANVFAHMRKGPGSGKSVESRWTAPSDCAAANDEPGGVTAVMRPPDIVKSVKMTVGLVPLCEDDSCQRVS